MSRKKGRSRIKRGDIPAVDALLRAQDADQEMARLEREALASVGRKVQSDATSVREPKPSRVELAYHSYLLSSDVDGFTTQPEPIKLGAGVSYQPDFWVTPAGGGAGYFVETKGTKVTRSKKTGKRGKPRPWFHDDGARVKTRWAAQVLAARGVRLVVAFIDPNTREWIHEEVPA